MNRIRAKTAGRDAFDDVFREHVDAVWRTAVAMGVDPDGAHDVVQEVFMTAYRRRSDFDGERSPRPWLLGITRNVARHHHRSTSRRNNRLQQVPPAPPPELPSEQVERREAADLLQAFLDQLDENKRVVFVLGHIEGLSAKQIARTLGLKRATVYARAQAAREALARFVARRHKQERRP